MNTLQVEKLSKAYGGQPVLRDVSFVLPAGGKMAFMGPSGCGKTTLARLLMGLETPDSGSLGSAAETRFCPVFQENRLCPGLNAVDNVALAAPKGAPPPLEALAEVGLWGDDLAKPAQLLSGGQKRRVALVRAVLAQGDVLLLDEAFKGLDDALRQQCYDFVRRRLAGRALIVITHDAAEAKAFNAAPLRLAEGSC